MSTRLALSSALSVMLMAAFAVFGGGSVGSEGRVAEASLFPARISAPALPALPNLPILR